MDRAQVFPRLLRLFEDFAGYPNQLYAAGGRRPLSLQEAVSGICDLQLIGKGPGSAGDLFPIRVQ